jgi:hypothetical protein
MAAQKIPQGGAEAKFYVKQTRVAEDHHEGRHFAAVSLPENWTWHLAPVHLPILARPVLHADVDGLWFVLATHLTHIRTQDGDLSWIAFLANQVENPYCAQFGVLGEQGMDLGLVRSKNGKARLALILLGCRLH